jgi:glycosyltransferase involved in cell wall biosynthesis
MQKILIVSASQYGYNSGIYYYTQHLKNHFKVTFLGLQLSKKPIHADGVILKQIPYNGMISTKIAFLKEVIRLHKTNHYDFILVFYFPGCSLLLLYIKQKSISLDIRTSTITIGYPFKEKFYNMIMKFEYRLYKNRTILSKNIAAYLKIKSRYVVLPLGGEEPDYKCNQKNYDSLNLLYIGTFYDRKIEITIKGFHRYLLNNKEGIPCHYTILGFGSESEVRKIRDTITELGLEEYVNNVGEVRYPDTIKYFQDNNVGVSFVPCTKYYDGQPPTKTYEYLLNGLPVIATRTTENKYVINNENGILIDDTEDGFCIGIEQIAKNKDNFNNRAIQLNNLKYSYKEIVETILKPYLLNKIE